MRWLALGIVKGQIAWQLDTIPRSHCIVAWFFKLTPLFQLSRQASLREPVAAMRFLTGSIERFDPGAEGRHRPSDLQIPRFADLQILDPHLALRPSDLQIFRSTAPGSEIFRSMAPSSDLEIFRSSSTRPILRSSDLQIFVSFAYLAKSSNLQIFDSSAIAITTTDIILIIGDRSDGRTRMINLSW